MCVCSVNQRGTVKPQYVETPKQIGWWVAQQINYSINCQLPHKLSFVADIPFHLQLLSQNPFV